MAANKPTVLLIEDDSLLVKMYETKFVSEGFEVLTAIDGQAGLALTKAKLPKVIVLDMMMPKLSGLDFLTQLSQDPNGKKIPVIVLTNLSKEEEAKKALALGAKEYLIKASLTPGQIVEKVKQYL